MKKKLFLGLKEFNYIKEKDSSIFENLKKHDFLDVFLIIGKYKKDLNLEDYKEYFKEENIFSISEKYLNSLTDIDKKLKEERYEKQKEKYYDDYYKIFYFKEECKFDISEILYIGHDIWKDGYYLSNFTTVDFILIKDILRNNDSEDIPEIKDLPLISDLKLEIDDHILSKKVYNYFYLNSYVKKELYSQIFGRTLFNDNLTLDKILKKDK